MFHWFTQWVSGNPYTYGVVFGVAALDAFFPLVPSETIVITAGVVAARGDLYIWLVVPLAAAGAFAGDNISFLLGRFVGDPVVNRLFRSEENKQRLAQAERLLQRRGTILIVAARFIPGGRTATTFAAGTLELPWFYFAAADAVAACVWALYAGMLGYLGGSAFSEGSWQSFALAFGVGLGVAGLAEVYRRIQRARGRDILGAEEPRTETE